MLIVHTRQQPPCWERVSKAFGVQWVPGVNVTYGSEIYCFNSEIPDDILVHEAVHVQQQKRMPADEYVEKFINDLHFRLEMEKAAYVVHNAYLRATIEDEAELFTKLYRNLKSFSQTVGFSLEKCDEILAEASRANKIMP